MLHEFITSNRAEIIARTRAKVALRPAPRPTQRELEAGVPMLLDQLVAALRGATPAGTQLLAMEATAALHGGHLLEQGFTLSQVVHDYGDVCQALTQLALDTKAAITTAEFQTLNRCLDDAIAGAVTAYTRLREQAISDEEALRSGVLAHELRNHLAAASVGFEMIRRGTVANDGSVSALISRNHAQMKSLIDRSLVGVRLSSGVEHRERIAVATLIEEAEVDGSLTANVRSQRLTVTTVDRGVEVQVDRQIVAGAIANLMQNAFKFTLYGGHVFLKASASAERVLIDVGDECGGLPPDKAAQLFHAFQQRGEDRSGMGLGLFISRKGVEANDGRLSVTDVPGRGCVFSIDLPRA